MMASWAANDHHDPNFGSFPAPTRFFREVLLLPWTCQGFRRSSRRRRRCPPWRWSWSAVDARNAETKPDLEQGCQIFLVHYTKSGNNVPDEHKMYQMNTKCHGHGHKIFQMAIKYINIFQSKALQNLPKLGFLVWKQTICQPCSGNGGKARVRNRATSFN
jgi:hypothetical protein